LRPVRVGQHAFKALVQEAYGRRCAVTGARIVPVLQAAHIRPVTSEGENRVDNGLLLRSDVHTLFDRGYLGVHPTERVLMVSPRLRQEYGNGEEFYARARARGVVASPTRRADRPNAKFLQWHADAVSSRHSRWPGVLLHLCADLVLQRCSRCCRSWRAAGDERRCPGARNPCWPDARCGAEWPARIRF
jgi:HNH endonuclease